MKSSKLILTLEFESADELKAFMLYADKFGLPSAFTAPAPALPAHMMPGQNFSIPIPGAPVMAAPVSDERDAAGVPWHPAFHASTKTQTAKGRYKVRKGRDEAAALAYEATYLNAPIAKPAATPVANGFSFATPATAAMSCTPEEFVAFINNLISREIITPNYIYTACQTRGIGNPDELATNDIVRAQIFGELFNLSRNVVKAA